MTQLEKNDLPVNHYGKNKELLKMVDDPNNSNASSSSTTCTPSTSTAASPTLTSSSSPYPAEMEAILAEHGKDPDYDCNEDDIAFEVRDESPTGPHPSSKKARLCSLSPPTPIITSVISGPIPLPPPTTLSLGGNAYGGNQSYLGMAESELPKYGSSERPSSPRSIYYGSGSSVSGSRMPGVVGFGNLGNTCFMNSGLQSLLNTPPLVEFFLKSPTIQNVSLPNAQLTQSFQNLIRTAWHGSMPVIYPRDFKDTLGNIVSQFKDCRQHDCQEFLTYTLDQLHEQLKIWNDSKRGGNTNETNSSGFASGPTESAASGCSIESMSNVNDSDVSSSLQSPGSNGDAENSTLDGVSNVKRRRLTDDTEISESTQPSVDKDKILTGGNSTSPVKEESSSECETGLSHQSEADTLMQLDDNENDDAESEVDMLEEGEDRERRALKQKAKQAEGFWMNYIRDNNTVIASSFQGMYKSTVTCSVCNYVSTTFEPFMYLSLPIPRTMDREFDVMFSSTNDFQVNKVNVTVSINDTVGKLKEQVIEKIFQEIQLCVPSSLNFVVAEVVNYHIITILKDDQPLKNIKDGIHNVYVLELNQNYADPAALDVVGEVTVSEEIFSSFPNQETSSFRPTTYLDEDWENDISTQETLSTSSVGGGGFIPASDDCNPKETENSCKENECEDPISCSVCLEDLPKSKLKQHFGCSCILCSDCISKTSECYNSNETVTSETAAAKTNTKLKCPVCGEIVDHGECFIPLISGNDGPRKMNLIPVLFYYSPNNDSNNNGSDVPRFIGHPLVVQLPSTLPAAEFYEFIRSIAPFTHNEYVVKNASWNGKECGACLYNRTCLGCEFRKDGIICINSRNSILISYSDLSQDLISSIEPPNMATCSNPYSSWPTTNCYKEERLIDIYECMDIFSQTECLDSQNPWYCSVCSKNQVATKTITICRFPDYLIVYLKRFVFMDHSSNKLNNKLKFPIDGFDVSNYIAEEFVGGEHIYDLYSCVCHFGSASGGHYTSYSKNPKFDEWHYFNDDSVSSKCPSKDEFSSGYILFYAKKGLKCEIPLKRMANPHIYNLSSNEVDISSKGSDECDTTTSTAPDCSVDVDGTTTYEAPIGPENGEDCLSSNQEDIITSSTCDSSSAFSRSNNECSSSSSSVTSSDKVNCVRENVSNLCIDVNRRKRGLGGSSTATSSTSYRPTPTSSAGTNHFDNFDHEFDESPRISKTYSEYAENKRLTKIAQRSKFSPNTQAPSSSGCSGPRK